uniref:NADH-ubiquinone oxidoreductase chain 4 n=1 Tax=Leiolepis rubritaeniata TaxID=3146766 RepID=A0A0A8J404_9SAUR|nr:NADH dehydrogenase subunit 4 [Leiolepis reevesii rubritaeniata]
MLKILIPTAMLAPSALLLNNKTLLTTMTLYSMILTVVSLQWLQNPMLLNSLFPNQYFSTDPISSPLLILSYWLLPMMIMASQNHLKTEPHNQKRLFMLNLALLQTSLAVCLLATNLTLFYVAFETTLIPTLILITRWGSQAERLTAGMYFMFYTLVGSLPLLISLLYMSNQMNHQNITLILTDPKLSNATTNIMWMACVLAFMVKMPLYGLHLWLPKAHVEAPIAGSMVLAALLLKLGGYGMIRVSTMMTPSTSKLHYPLITLALWGLVMTGLICLSLTNMKAMSTYSSVGHMGMVAAASVIQTPGGITGKMIMMIAHGLTSSMLFCLANMLYERTGTRTLIMMRGLQIITPMMTFYWLAASLSNMALPPTINLMGELLIIVSMFNWNPTTIILTGTGTVITAIYSLYMFAASQQGKLPKDMMMNPPHTREYLLLTMHLLPMALLMLNPQLISG